MAEGLRVAADIGGTFTDLAFIARDGLVATRKVPSTPDNYADAVIRGIEELMAEQKLDKGAIAEVLHGCTIATNTILEHKGAKTALITTRGFRDVLELRRIRVPRLYEPLYVKPQPLVPRQLRLEVIERVGPRGEVVTPLNLASVKKRDRAGSRPRRSRPWRCACCTPTPTPITSGASARCCARRCPAASSRCRSMCCRRCGNTSAPARRSSTPISVRRLRPICAR